MNRFVELLRQKPPIRPGERFADDRSERFPGVLTTSPSLRLWEREDGIPDSGCFLLIGVATWSGYDMNMLDHIERAAPNRPNVQVRVFDADTFQSAEEFEAVFPGIGSIHHTPAVGYWIHGQLLDKAVGYHGRILIANVLRIDPEPLHAKTPAS